MIRTVTSKSRFLSALIFSFSLSLLVCSISAFADKLPGGGVSCYPELPQPPKDGCVICGDNYNPNTGERLPECICAPEMRENAKIWCDNHTDCGPGEEAGVVCSFIDGKFVCKCKKGDGGKGGF